MSATTRLEVMAEVGRLADTIYGGAPLPDVEALVGLARVNLQGPTPSRCYLLRAAAWALLALEAHDAEAKAGA